MLRWLQVAVFLGVLGLQLLAGDTACEDAHTGWRKSRWTVEDTKLNGRQDREATDSCVESAERPRQLFIYICAMLFIKLFFNDRQDKPGTAKYLVDVFYYCCKDCSRTYGMTDDQIINHVGNLLLKNLPKRTNETYRYTPGIPLPYCLYDDGTLATRLPGINSCVFLLDSSSLNRFYTGPFSASDFDQMRQSTERRNRTLADLVESTFPIICPKSQCLQYLSPLEFFFYCCCDKNFEKCAYSDDVQLLAYASLNADAWMKRPEIRSFYKIDVRRMDKASGNVTIKEIYGRPWVYRKYVYSMPTTDEHTSKVLHSVDNIRLRLCAIGSYNVTVGEWRKHEFEVHTRSREYLAKPQEHCLLKAKLGFQNTDRNPPTTIAMHYTSDTEKVCKEDGCFYEGPVCVQDLLNRRNVTATIRCCCSSQDVCNHFGNGYYELMEQILNVKHKFPCTSQSFSYSTLYLSYRMFEVYILCTRYFTLDTYKEIMLVENYSYYAAANSNVISVYNKASEKKKLKQDYPKSQYLGCFRKQVLPLRDPFCKVFMPMIVNFAFCICFQSPGAEEPCDSNFHEIIAREGPGIPMPTCSQTVGVPELKATEYDFGVLGPAKYRRVKVTHHPLCYDMLTIDPYKNGVEHRSGHFDELTDYLYDMKVIHPDMHRMFDISVPVPGQRNKTLTRHVILCYSDDTETGLCNGRDRIRRHLLPQIIRKEAAAIDLPQKSRCYVTGRTNRVICRTRSGCFDFHTVHGKSLRHCIDKIPKIVSANRGLTFLYTCYSHSWMTGKEEMRCAAMTENNVNSTDPLIDGILCCCRQACNIASEDSMAESTDGYFPFDM